MFFMKRRAPIPGAVIKGKERIIATSNLPSFISAFGAIWALLPYCEAFAKVIKNASRIMVVPFMVISYRFG